MVYCVTFINEKYCYLDRSKAGIFQFFVGLHGNFFCMLLPYFSGFFHDIQYDCQSRAFLSNERSVRWMFLHILTYHYHVRHSSVVIEYCHVREKIIALYATSWTAKTPVCIIPTTLTPVILPTLLQVYLIRVIQIKKVTG